MDFIGFLFVASILPLMAAQFIEALIGCRADHEDVAQDISAQPWAPRTYTALRMRSAYALTRIRRRRRRLRPAVRKQFKSVEQASRPLKAGEG